MFLLKHTYWLVGVLLLFGCAQQVAPTGGPKDETPPEILSEIPANLSTNFDGNKIEIAFDEFIKLQAPSEQIIISPPIAKQPSYQLKKKSLIVKFEAPLSPKTTYTINFGEAIRDNNEGNILANYTYVFSTGNHLDSMQLKGRVSDVLTGEPEEGALVMLYKNNIDSLPLDTTPDYFTRSNKSGNFHIKNIANQDYKIFALKDENANYKFDVPTEKIGFLDTLVEPFFPPRPTVRDTSAVDSLTTDSSIVDSVLQNVEVNAATTYNIQMFIEEDTTQFLKKAYCDYFGKLVFVYNRPIERFQLSIDGYSNKKQWRLEELTSTKDSVIIWVTAAVPDTMSLIISPDNSVIDTVEIVMKSLEETTKPTKRFSSRKSKEKPFGLTVNIHPNKRSPKPGDPLVLTWSHPILGLDISKLKLYEDSLRVLYDIQTEDPSLKSFDVIFDWKKDKTYRMVIADSAFTDLYNLWNDTIETTFVGTDKDAFGSISLNIKEAPENQVIIEVFNSAEKLVGQQTIINKGLFEFKQLNPGNYRIDLISDINENGKWDSGRYSEKTQPEPVKVLQSSAEVRQNWDLELEWNPNDDK